MADTTRILGPQVQLDTFSPFRFERQPGNSFLGLLQGVMSGVETTAKLEGISRLRADKAQQKLRMRGLEMEMEKDQQALEVVKNAWEIDPRTGRGSLNREKIVNGLMSVDPQRAIRAQQAFDSMVRNEALAEQQRIKAEREALLAPLKRQKIEAEITAINRGGTTGKTLEERAAAGNPTAVEGLRLREEQRARERRAQQEDLVSAVGSRELAREGARRQFDQDLTVGERIKDIGLFINKESGDPVDQSLTVGEFREGQRAKQFRKMTPKQFNRLQSTKSLLPLMQSMADDLQSIYGPGGIFEELEASGRFKAGVQGALANAFQTNPELVAVQRKIKGNIDLIRRNFQGQVGTQTERDAERGLVTLPVLSGLPDTKEVAFETFDSLTNIINSMLGTMVGNKKFNAPELAPLRRALTQPVSAPRAGLGQQGNQPLVIHSITPLGN